MALGGPSGRCGRARITAPPSASRADWGSVNVRSRHSPAHSPSETRWIFLGLVNVVNVVNVFPGPLSRGRARAHMRKGWKNIHDIHRRSPIPLVLHCGLFAGNVGFRTFTDIHNIHRIVHGR